MVKNVLDLLNIYEYYGESKRIDIAKGRYELPSTWKGLWILIKRIVHGRKSRSRSRGQK